MDSKIDLMTLLPPGVTASRFRRYLDALVQVVGQDRVLTTDEDLLTYRDALSPRSHGGEEMKRTDTISYYYQTGCARWAKRYWQP